jgi:hypothetical protein
MKILAIKTLVGAVALATLTTAPVLAQSTRGPAPEDGYGSHYDQPITRNPDDVVIGGKVVGRDPDPFIRGQSAATSWVARRTDRYAITTTSRHGAGLC